MLEFGTVILLLVMAMAVALASYRLRASYSVGLVIFGVMVGLASLFFPALGTLPSFSSLFSGDVFFGILLPPLIYEASLRINYKLLRSRVRLIMFLVFLGVIISTVLTGVLVSAITLIPLSFALLLGAILSPTDPVAVVDLFRRLKVPQELSTIIETESLLNDGVGIVVFAAILQLVSMGRFDVLTTASEFGWLILVGTGVGLAFASAAYFLHRWVDDPNMETALSVVMAYGSFNVAVALGASGIISTSVTGIATGTWVVPRAMSERVRSTLFSFWNVVSYIVNSIIFLSLGLLVNLMDVFRNLPLIATVLVLVTLARASFIYVHYPFSRLAGNSHMPITWYNAITLAGVRGAIPVVLALTLLQTSAPIPSDIRVLIVSTVIGCALFSITVQSLLAGRYMKKRFSREEPEDKSGETPKPEGEER